MKKCDQHIQDDKYISAARLFKMIKSVDVKDKKDNLLFKLI